MKIALYNTLGALLFLLGTSACTDTTPGGPIAPGKDPNFKIVANTDAGMNQFNRKVVVFGIDIYAAPKVEDSKLLHAANVMAQYLDNNADGTPDNLLVVEKMVANKAFLFLWKSQGDMGTPPAGRLGQDLGNDETNPNYVQQGKTGRFDASLEEVWHLITHAGYAYAYPSIFGEQQGTTLTNAMDKARGGSFTSIPNPYPTGAWYTYDDTTCTYDCQATEYFYWAMTSILGAQTNRAADIENEWKLNTKAKVAQTDTAIYALLTTPRYQLPQVLPNGKYKQ